jgi:primosomal protein N' (replication factor Y) (superfamily II helicase)
VRVPLGGRRVRGWVLGRGDDTGDRPLRRVIGRSSDIPVFDRRLLATLRWAAGHYVAPLASLLAKATPPNLPRSEEGGWASGEARQAEDAPSVRVWVGGGPWAPHVAERAAPALERGGSVMVVAPTWVEASALAEDLAGRFGGERVVVVSSHLKAAALTSAWVEAATIPGRIVVGTRELALWPVARLNCAIIVGEGRRGLKDKATPTVHARDVLYRRSGVEGFALVLCDPVPTAEALALAGEVESISPRPWGLVEVADRRREPPGRALLGPVASAALKAVVSDGGRVLLFTHRRATAHRCVRCRALRRCGTCGSGPGPGPACERCGAPVGPCESCSARRFEAIGAGAARVASEAARLLGSGAVGWAGEERSVIVGTERDLPGLEVDLTIVVDGDGPLMAPTYRAAEDGLRLLARAVGAAGAGRGRRGVVQTQQPEHPVMTALRTGDGVPFVRSDGSQRARLGFPPGGELIAVEAGDLPPEWQEELPEALGDRATVLGPAIVDDRLRWLIQGRDLASARIVLRSVVGKWREGGARVRVDADPIDL